MAILKRVHNKNGEKEVRYQVQLYLKGKRVGYKTFESKWKAITWQEQEKKFLEWSSSELKKSHFNYLFSDCVTLFQKKAVPLLQIPTQQSYISGMRYFAGSPLYNIKMTKLNAHHIHTWMDWLKKHPTAKNASRKTFQFELKVLNIILNWYKNFVNEDFNIPITKQHKKSCQYKIIPPRCPDYFMRPTETRKWLNWIKENRDPVFWRIAFFMLLTGVRICEVCAMKWDAINLEEGTARVMRIIRWDFHTRKPKLVETTKTHTSSRLLILPDDLIHVLKKMKEESLGNGLIFFNSNSEKPLNYVTIQRVFNHGFKALNLPWRSTHILRHSYATMALLATRDLVSVQASFRTSIHSNN